MCFCCAFDKCLTQVRQLFGEYMSPQSVQTLAVGHVVPDEHLIGMAVNRGPGGKLSIRRSVWHWYLVLGRCRLVFGSRLGQLAFDLVFAFTVAAVTTQTSIKANIFILTFPLRPHSRRLQTQWSHAALCCCRPRIQLQLLETNRPRANAGARATALQHCFGCPAGTLYWQKRAF